MKAFVAVTDWTWYRQLEAAALDEVNFWLPSGGGFAALSIGEPFFFKTHYPHNRVVGGGFYSGFARLTLGEAWDFYQQANGASTMEAMLAQILRYRSRQAHKGENPIIGCVFLRDVTYFTESLPPPPDFAANIVRGKTYEMARPEYASYVELAFRAMRSHRLEDDDLEAWYRDGPVYGDLQPTIRRLGQRAFQGVVLDAYNYRCAVTGDRIRPVLQAAHIRPLPLGGEHRLDNGVLLRSDVHTLFDRGYVGVDSSYRLHVSPMLREQFDNGEEFYERARSRTPISLPTRRVDRPNREFLEWHMDEVFLAS